MLNTYMNLKEFYINHLNLNKALAITISKEILCMNKKVKFTSSGFFSSQRNNLRFNVNLMKRFLIVIILASNIHYPTPVMIQVSEMILLVCLLFSCIPGRKYL